MEKIIPSLFNILADVTDLLCVHSRYPARRSDQTEVAKILCMDSRHHARHTVRMEVAIVLGIESRGRAGGYVPVELLHGQDNTFSFQRSGENNRFTLCV